MQNKLLGAVAIAAACTSYLPVALAEAVIDEVVVIGSRSVKERSVSDSPVPVDIIAGNDFIALGNIQDITDLLRASVPSFTATPATGDGSAFVRPTSLRGMAPDQTLILINGKRRHRSALVQFFAPAAGNGSHGADVGMIPGLAIERVEVLRDGAASQYGSDAIAGVINLVTKKADAGGTIKAQFGRSFEGENSERFAANGGFRLGDSGYLNLTFEALDNDAHSRGIQRPDAQALIDAGVAGVGADTPFGDEPLVQSWGRPESKGARLFFNAGVDINDHTSLYAFGNYAEVDGRFRFFYRHPTGHDSLKPLNIAAGFNVLPAGYTPYLDGDQEDYSIIFGIEGAMPGGWTYDVSASYGENDLDYYLYNTVNSSLGLDANSQIPQRDFDVGGYTQEELNFNIDFSIPISNTLNLAFGAEWREETYVAHVGEPNAYEGEGSNGLKGTALRDSGEFDRDNYAIYTDIEQDVTDQLLIQYALRYEDFSDFGGTTNGKIAVRYRVNDRLALRAAASTGFHAPTPGQANVRTTITNFDGATGLQTEEGLIRSTHPLAVSVGGTELTEEKSFNISAGLTFDLLDNTSITLDVYQIEVEDRIYRTRNICIPDDGMDDCMTSPGTTISFYTNALEVESRGIDLVINSTFEWAGGVSTDLTLAYAYNKVEVTDQAVINDIIPVEDALIEDIENNYPNSRAVLTANTGFNDAWNLLIRANYYGSHYDERGRINAAVNPSAEIDPVLYIDMELGYKVTDNFRLTLGAANLFDKYNDKIGPPNSNRLSVGLPYPRRSPGNFEGGSWYLSGAYTF